MIMIPMASGQDSSDDSSENIKEFLPPNYAFSTNYYNSYGEPDLYASLLGDYEFERGETAQVQINLANKGVLYGFKYATSVGTNEGKHASSLQELQYETMRTTAIGINAELISTSPYIEIDPSASIRSMKKLVPGSLPDNPLVYVITISDHAPAGIYYLQLPVSYEYQSEVRMTTNEVYRLGVTGLDHTTDYKSANKTLIIPIFVKGATEFEITDVSGHLTAGFPSVVNVTYKNIGEIPAIDAIVRVVVMKPLVVEQGVLRLGTVEPGESKTVSFKATADRNSLVKDYGVDSEIKYIDENGNTAFSENMKISVPLEPAPDKLGVGTLALGGVIVLGIFMIIKLILNIEKYK
ncbi:MAG: hypothetical protein Q7J10_10970 [Methanosarcinaceae archaeon]|nr:hypothetical protein [Methanosarcinaceae archaeon]